MKRFILAVALLAAPMFAQQATLTTPEAVTATKIVVASVSFDRQVATITIEYQASDATVKRTTAYTAMNAEYISFLTALGTTRATETGTVPRRMQFRVIGWLSDNSKLADLAGTPVSVTVVP